MNYSDLGHNSFERHYNYFWAISGFTYDRNGSKYRLKFAANYEYNRLGADPFVRGNRRTVVVSNEVYRGFNVRAGLHNPFKEQTAQFLYGADLSYRGGRTLVYWRGYTPYYASQVLVSSYLGLRVRFNETVSMQAGTSLAYGYQITDGDENSPDNNPYSGKSTFNFDPVQQLTLSIRLR